MPDKLEGILLKSKYVPIKCKDAIYHNRELYVCLRNEDCEYKVKYGDKVFCQVEIRKWEEN